MKREEASEYRPTHEISMSGGEGSGKEEEIGLRGGK